MEFLPWNNKAVMQNIKSWKVNWSSYSSWCKNYWDKIKYHLNYHERDEHDQFWRQFDSDFNLCFLERGWNPDPDFWCFLSYIFPEKLIKIQQIVWKIWKFSSSILAIFANFSDFLTFSCWRKKTNDVSI